MKELSRDIVCIFEIILCDIQLVISYIIILQLIKYYLKKLYIDGPFPLNDAFNILPGGILNHNSKVLYLTKYFI